MSKFRDDDVSMLVSAIRREPGRFVFLTGSGMSMTAGVPTSSWLLSDIRQKFSHELSGLRAEHLQNLSLCMRALSVEERRSVLKPYYDKLKINWSHIALACMMRANHVHQVLTVNVDNILTRACGLIGLYPAIYDVSRSSPTEFDFLSSPSVIHLRGQGYSALLTDPDVRDDNSLEKFRPLLQHTFANSNLVIIGYDGRLDPLFPTLMETFNGRRRIYWLGHQEEPHRHLEPFLKGRHQNLIRYLGGVDADEMMITLARELGCFPPDVLSHPERHVLAELSDVAAFPLAKTKMTFDPLEAVRAKLRGDIDLKKWPVTSGGTVGTQPEVHKRGELPNASRNDNPVVAPPDMRETVVPLTPVAAPKEPFRPVQVVQSLPKEAEAPTATLAATENADFSNAANDEPHHVKTAPEETNEDPEVKASAHFVAGYKHSEMAEHGDLERHLRKACEEYAQAVRVKPNFFEALNNWGICLRMLGNRRQDENFFTHAIHKYELALKYKPDFLQALNNLAIVLSELAKLRGDDSLYALSIEKYEQALAIEPDFYQALSEGANPISLTWKLTDKDEYMRRVDDNSLLTPALAAHQISKDAGQAADIGEDVTRSDISKAV